MVDQEEQAESLPPSSLDGGDQNDTGDAGDPAPPAPLDPMTALRTERDELESRLLRVSADYQNFVRRTQQNTKDACEQQLFQLAKALLMPLDHLDHAMALDLEKAASDSFVKGVQIVRDELTKVLDQFGIKRLKVRAGDEFDPVCHEAVQRMAVEGLASGVVAEQVQSGYVLGDKTLRPAKVVVAQ